jgi:hypothetical protein
MAGKRQLWGYGLSWAREIKIVGFQPPQAELGTGELWSPTQQIHPRWVYSPHRQSSRPRKGCSKINGMKSTCVGFSPKAEAEPRAKLGTPTEQSLLLQVLEEHKYKCNYCMYLVFKSLVDWTKKMTATQPNTTKCNQTIGCSCSDLGLVWLPVASGRSMFFLPALSYAYHNLMALLSTIKSEVTTPGHA